MENSIAELAHLLPGFVVLADTSIAASMAANIWGWLDVGVLAQTTGSTGGGTAGGTAGATGGSTAGTPIVPVKPGPGSTGGQTALAGNAPLDFSITGMFLRADIVVQSVIVSLALASFWSWAIIFEKLIHLRRVNSRSSKFEDAFWSGGSLEDLFDKMNNRPRDPMSAMFNAAMREWQRRPGGERASAGPRGNLAERIDRVMNVTFGREVERLERSMNFLASVGAVAPFIGLFGTVWGIMNAFQAIALSKSTNLAAVAPGIAEALFATALGLVAAIPAVIAYNKLSNDVSRYANRLDAFSGEFSAILSRQLDD